MAFRFGRDDHMRSGIGLVLIVNLALFLIIIGLVSWSFNQEITSTFSGFKHLGGNVATFFVLIYGLLGGVIGVLSVIAGFIHHRAWSRESLAIATSTAFVSFASTVIAFGLVIKEIIVGGHRGDILKTLEGVIIASTFFQLLYLLLLHSGMYNGRYGPAYA